MKRFARAILLCITTCVAFAVVGCASSSGYVKGTNAEPGANTNINNVLVITKLSDYDQRFNDSVSPAFNALFSKMLSAKGVRNEVVNDNDVFDLETVNANAKARALGYDNILFIQFIHYSTAEYGIFNHGELQARLWRTGSNKAIWVGRYTWFKGSTVHSVEDRTKVLADTIMAGLDRNVVFTKWNGVDSQNQMAKEFASQRPTKLYAAKISAKIRGNVILPPGVDASSSVELRVTQLPNGEVLDVRVLKSSGNAQFDAAVDRAIRKSTPLPIPESGKPERFIDITYKAGENKPPPSVYKQPNKAKICALSCELRYEQCTKDFLVCIKEQEKCVSECK